jgi:hypothetical protein
MALLVVISEAMLLQSFKYYLLAVSFNQQTPLCLTDASGGM